MVSCIRVFAESIRTESDGSINMESFGIGNTESAFIFRGLFSGSIGGDFTGFDFLISGGATFSFNVQPLKKFNSRKPANNTVRDEMIFAFFIVALYYEITPISGQCCVKLF